MEMKIKCAGRPRFIRPLLPLPIPIPAFAVFLIPLLLVVWGCEREGEPRHPVSTRPSPESFSFFEIGANTRLDGRLRDSLRETLGKEGVARRDVIDLEINFPGFLKRFFPPLGALNRELNSEIGARVEHNVTTMTYRYIRGGAPFDLVRLVFSNYSGKPLRFFMRTETGGEALLRLLNEQFGPPEVAEWGNDLEQSHVWKKNGDYLIFSVVTNQFGRPEFEINLFFANNLKELLAHEAEDDADGKRRNPDNLKNVFSQNDEALSAMAAMTFPGYRAGFQEWSTRRISSRNSSAALRHCRNGIALN